MQVIKSAPVGHYFICESCTEPSHNLHEVALSKRKLCAKCGTKHEQIVESARRIFARQRATNPETPSPPSTRRASSAVEALARLRPHNDQLGLAQVS